MALHWLSPTPVLEVDLELDAATATAMLIQLEHFDAQLYQHLSSAIATASPGISWAMPAWISCIA